MAIDRKEFFDSIRNGIFHGRLKQSQVDGLNVILDAWEATGLQDLRWLAYILATVAIEMRLRSCSASTFSKIPMPRCGPMSPLTS